MIIMNEEIMREIRYLVRCNLTFGEIFLFYDEIYNGKANSIYAKQIFNLFEKLFEDHPSIYNTYLAYEHNSVHSVYFVCTHFEDNCIEEYMPSIMVFSKFAKELLFDDWEQASSYIAHLGDDEVLAIEFLSCKKPSRWFMKLIKNHGYRWDEFRRWRDEVRVP